MWARNVESEAKMVRDPSIASPAARTSFATASDATLIVTSRVMRARLTECMSTAAIVPPASPIALVSTPNAPGSFGISMRMMTVKLIAGNAMVLPVLFSADRHLGHAKRWRHHRAVKEKVVGDPVDAGQYVGVRTRDGEFVDRGGEFAVLDEKAARAARVGSRRMFVREADRVEDENPAGRRRHQLVERRLPGLQEEAVGANPAAVGVPRAGSAELARAIRVV